MVPQDHLKTYVRGREFNTHSTSVTTVNSSSYDSFAFLRIFLRQRFTQRIKRLKNPPHQGALSKLNLHFILRFNRYLCTSGRSNTVDNTLAAVLKVLALSDTTYLGILRLQRKCLKLVMNVSELRSGTTSRWRALVLPHVNNAR